MGAFEGLLFGLSVALQPQNLLAALAGALAGTAIGVLPGLGPVAGVALVLPLTFAFDPATGLIVMAGIFYGSMYGGSTTAILMNIPGESASVVTAIDGYRLTRKGRAGAVLAIVAVGSFVGATLSILGVMLAAPALASVALLFGPAEFLALTAGGLIVLSRISGGSFAAAGFSCLLGVALGTVGQEAVTGQNRYTFGVLELTEGINLVPVVVGLYGVAEILNLVETSLRRPGVVKLRLAELLPSREEWRRSVPPWLRGTAVGFGFGLVPGPAATLSSFASYRLEQAVSRHRAEIGTGAIEGVAGPETANNAAATSAMVPLLSLGLPFTPIGALMISAMMVQGVQPGPLLVQQHPDIFWGLIASLYVGNVMLLVLNLPLVGVWVSLLRIPVWFFVPMLLVIACIGAYSVHNSLLDLWVLLGAGMLGYAFNKCHVPLAPLVVGLILGPEVEKHLREGLFLSQGDFLYFLEGPIAPAVWGAALLVAVIGALRRRRGRPEPAVAES